MEYEPAGFRARANAAIVDGVIITVATFPISLLLGILWAVFSGQGEEPGSLLQLVNMVITYGIVFLYWGWFYKNKGASPGKLMFKLKVVKTDTGKNLSYKDTFMREFLAKILSAVLLFAGYLMVIFRNDKKALHDILVNTQVLAVKKA